MLQYRHRQYLFILSPEMVRLVFRKWTSVMWTKMETGNRHVFWKCLSVHLDEWSLIFGFICCWSALKCSLHGDPLIGRWMDINSPLEMTSCNQHNCCHGICCLEKPEKYSVNMHLCVSGYFIYDFFDMVINQKISHSWELLFHHVVVSRHKTRYKEIMYFWRKPIT